MYTLSLQILALSLSFLNEPQPTCIDREEAFAWTARQAIVSQVAQELSHASGEAAVLESVKQANEKLKKSTSAFAVQQPLSLMNPERIQELTQFELANLIFEIQNAETRKFVSDVLVRNSVVERPLFKFQSKEKEVSLNVEGFRNPVKVFLLNTCHSPKLPAAKTWGPFELQSWLEKEDAARVGEDQQQSSNAGPQKDPSLRDAVLQFWNDKYKSNENPKDFYAVIAGRINLTDASYMDPGEFIVQVKTDGALRITHLVNQSRIPVKGQRDNECGGRYVFFVNKSDLPIFKRTQMDVKVLVAYPSDKSAVKPKL